MRIEQEIVKANLPADAPAKEITYRVRNLTDLLPGDIFKATVTDIKPNQVSIRFLNGGELTAKSLVLPEARIGDDTVFQVKENNRGQMKLEMLKPNGDVLKENIAREALISADIYPNGENIKLAKTLMDNNLPIDSASLSKAVFFHYSAANLPLDKMVFLLKENFPMDSVNVSILNRLTEEGGMAQKLSETADSFAKLDTPVLAKVLEKFVPLLENTAPEFAAEIKNAAENGSDLRNLSFKLKRYIAINLKDKNSLNDLSDFFKNLHQALDDTEKALSAESKGQNAAGEVLEKVTQLKQSVEFMDHIGNYKEYMQIPLSFEGNINNAELFIFKEPRKKKNLSQRASVLIAMDYANLGRVETFIDKTDRALNFQFRAYSKETLKLLQNSASELSEAMLCLGYNITGVSFKNISESFTVLNDNAASEETFTEKKRYSFDMRV
ncbi:MAG: flagellar hook-length control protein FliK [Clostridiales bacterium]|jgi:hypothetical protein|nr:flagellar hook-length control protein FliK [Clostridiales bacterium]